MSTRQKILFLIVAVYVVSLFSQEPQWRLANGTTGIHIAAIDIYHNDPDTLYAIGDKFLISADRGENWEIIKGPTTDIGALKIDPFNSKIVYVSHYGLDWESNDISMTTDGFSTWKRLFIGRRSPSPVIEIDPIDLRTVYAVQGPGIIHRSSDYFQTWDSIYPPANDMTSLIIAPSNNNILYAGYNSEILKSIDKGENWTKLQFPIQYNSWTSLAVDPYNADIVYAGIYSRGSLPGGIYKSIDGGITWEEKNNGLSYENRDILTISINNNNSIELLIGLGGGNGKLVFRTLDGGNNWFEFSNGLPDSGGHVKSIAIDTLNGRTYIGGGIGGIYIHQNLNSIKNRSLLAPEEFSLYQNYPNPFNSSTTITYKLSIRVFVSITVYNTLGKEVRKLIEDIQNPGIYKVNFNAGDLPSGTYFYRFKAGGKVVIRKALLIK